MCHNLERYGRRSFSCAGPVLWNSLPEDMRLADSLRALFKSQIKTHFGTIHRCIAILVTRFVSRYSYKNRDTRDLATFLRILFECHTNTCSSSQLNSITVACHVYSKHQRLNLPSPQPSIAHQCGVEVPTHIDSMQL